MQFKKIHLLVFSLILLSAFAAAQNNETTNLIKLQTAETNFEVGNTIVLKFTTSKGKKPLLYCSNSYGATLVSAELKNNTIQFIIPKNITNKIGVVNWQLLNKNHSVSGKFSINPIANVASLETYIGPPSIEAGEKDYTMLVVIPTDSLDNPVPTNTKVNAKHQFLNSEEKEIIYTKNLIAFKNINSKKESGRMLVSSESLGVNSKEFTVNVWAAIPTNFTIWAKRPHEYADGNQVTTFVTSTLKDQQNNVVSNGTFVTFFITNTNGNILKTTGTTIKGIAQAQIIHPDFKDSWSVKAYVDGMAESNIIMLNYKAVITNFNVAFSKNNRKITVGPLQSFMQQMIPDGLQVELEIYKGNSLVKTIKKTAYNGFVNFNLKPAIFKNNTYKLVVKTAGLKKEFNTKKLW